MSEEERPHVLIDGFALLFRSFYALPPMTTSRGEPTSGLYGFCVVLMQLLRERDPAGFAIAIDLPGRSVRREQMPAYKAHRKPAPDPLRVQSWRLRELADAAAIPLHAVEGWEADDVIGTLTTKLPRSLVVTGDSDLLQLVDPRTTVHFLGQRGRKTVDIDLDAFRDRYGFAPDLLPTYKAMVGDPSDGLPGVQNLGRASAKALVAAHGDAEGILRAHAEGRIGNRRLVPILGRVGEDLRRYEALGRIRRDLELTPPLTATIDRDRLREWFVHLEFHSLAERLPIGSEPA